MLSYAFEILKLESVTFKTMKNNIGMRGFFEKFNIKLKEIIKHGVKELDGHIEDDYHYELTKSAWKNTKELLSNVIF